MGRLFEGLWLSPIKTPGAPQWRQGQGTGGVCDGIPRAGDGFGGLEHAGPGQHQVRAVAGDFYGGGGNRRDAAAHTCES